MIPAGTSQRSISGGVWSTGAKICGPFACLPTTFTPPPQNRTATGFAHGPLSATSTVAQTGGVLQFVVPIRTQCVGCDPATMPGSLQIRFVPEPSEALSFVAAGAVLVVLGWRKRQVHRS
jgi:hypothetical protein